MSVVDLMGWYEISKGGVWCFCGYLLEVLS